MVKKVLCVGAARSGLAVSRLLNKNGYEVVLTDARSVPEKKMLEEEGITVYDEGHPDFLKDENWDFIVKNPGIPYHAPFIASLKDRFDIFTEIDVASRLASNYQYGAITGTDGKTTTTMLLEDMLKKKKAGARSAGNIGTPLSELVLDGAEELDVALELSNFQLLGMENFHAHAATITNLAPDHQDYMGNVDDYYRSKFKIVQNMNEEDFFILNLDDENIVRLYEELPEKPFKTVTLSLQQPADIRVENGVVLFENTPLFSLSSLKLKGDFNLMNAMMAASLAYSLGVSPQQIEEAVSEFKPVEHRIEYVGKIGDVEIYNDSKSTNTHSTLAALSAFDEPLYLLAGGFDKGIDYSPLKEVSGKVKTCFSFGKIAPVFNDVFEDTRNFETMEQALDAALETAKPGEVILLSPATSSFDQFRNYEERGRTFKKLAKERGAV